MATEDTVQWTIGLQGCQPLSIQCFSTDMVYYIWEKFEGTKGANIIRKSNQRRTNNAMAKRKRTNGQRTIHKTPHRKPKIE